MVLINVVWPALWVFTELWRFWFLVVATIAIETLTVRGFLNYSFQKSIIVSLVGNFFSALVGTFLMVFAMLFWHFIADRFMSKGTFDMRNWIATFILMFLGSSFIEISVITIIFSERIKNLLVPLLIGNFLTYSFISYNLIRKERQDKLGQHP